MILKLQLNENSRAMPKRDSLLLVKLHAHVTKCHLILYAYQKANIFILIIINDFFIAYVHNL